MDGFVYFFKVRFRPTLWQRDTFQLLSRRLIFVLESAFRRPPPRNFTSSLWVPASSQPANVSAQVYIFRSIYVHIFIIQYIWVIYEELVYKFLTFYHTYYYIIHQKSSQLWCNLNSDGLKHVTVGAAKHMWLFWITMAMIYLLHKQV